ncbi:MAG TPA: Glu/Leu/Phe/Val dehydrogenase dimerization domain-containing protein [Terriglobales bacterium]|nr:Glu/Leu/Phe/Val dehydrogenase dimerization domain-containing protein [Terriglobales bacterium]
MNAKDFLPVTIELAETPDSYIELAADVEELARYLDLEDWIVNRIRHIEREVTVNLPLVRDGSRALSITGFRAQHLSARGPMYGPVSICPGAQLSHLRAAAIEMTFQAALLNSPFGGAAGAIVCDPDTLSESDLRCLAKEYVRGLRGILGRFNDVLGPGEGCNEQIMAWMLDSHAQLQGHMDLGVVAGRAAQMWGVENRGEIVGRGLAVVLQNVLRERKPSLRDITVAVQGFGPLGTSLALGLQKSGTRLVAVADASGGVLAPSGIDVNALSSYVAEKRFVLGFPEAEQVSNADVVGCQCDVLIAAAGRKQITNTNVAQIQAHAVVEAVTGGITSGAEALLSNAGTVVIPSILASSGETVAAFVEWNQSLRFAQLPPADVEQELESRIGTACQQVKAAALKHNISLRRAAHLVAMERIASELRMCT